MTQHIENLEIKVTIEVSKRKSYGDNDMWAAVTDSKTCSFRADDVNAEIHTITANATELVCDQFRITNKIKELQQQQEDAKK